MDDFKQLIVPSAIAGGLGIAVTPLLTDKKVASFVFEKTIPINIAIGLSIFASSMLGEILRYYALPHIANSEKWTDFSSALVSSAFNAVAIYGVLYMANPLLLESIGTLKIVIFSVVADALSNYGWSNYLKPLLA